MQASTTTAITTTTTTETSTTCTTGSDSRMPFQLAKKQTAREPLCHRAPPTKALPARCCVNARVVPCLSGRGSTTNNSLLFLFMLHYRPEVLAFIEARSCSQLPWRSGRDHGLRPLDAKQAATQEQAHKDLSNDLLHTSVNEPYNRHILSMSTYTRAILDESIMSRTWA
jgi:hypothetical protein